MLRKNWTNAINENPIVKKRVSYTVECIQHLLLAQWDQKQRATRMKVELFVKDLTWETLNNHQVREKIKKAYPELSETGLYKSRHAWTPEHSDA